MRYFDGQIIMIGDNVTLAGQAGVICCCIGDGSFSEAYPGEVWRYLQRGVMIDVPTGGGLFHFDTTEDEEDLKLVSRLDSTITMRTFSDSGY